jgi:endo-1,4-beta-mannosidase
MDWIALAQDGRRFVYAKSGRQFTPWGFNYDRDYKLRLLEEYWETEWPTVVADFREMKALGANVVRVHLQFPKFMDAPDEPNEESLERLGRLLKLAEETGLYLDLTGLGCYRKGDVPRWYDSLAEAERWRAQAKFWEAIAARARESPAVFCYNLMNEPVVPVAPRKEGDWLVAQLAGFYYVQAIALDRRGRDGAEIARDWIALMRGEIRRHDARHLITVGLLPNSAHIPGPGFVPQRIAGELDFIAVHLYPRAGHLEEDLATLKHFQIGKPVVIEEIFPMNAGARELSQFIERSRGDACGWIGFYWGQTPEELSHSTSVSAPFMKAWLELFQNLRPNHAP